MDRDGDSVPLKTRVLLGRSETNSIDIIIVAGRKENMTSSRAGQTRRVGLESARLRRRLRDANRE